MISIEIQNLIKKYQNDVIFDNLNLSINSGKCNFITGFNGSGKSTLLKCLLNQTKYKGLIIKNNLQFSYCPDRINFPEFTTVYNYLLSVSMMFHLNKEKRQDVIENYLNKFDIIEYKKHLLSELSKGTLQKILIIHALLKDADVYIFDEPIDGLDDDSKKVFISLVKDIVSNDKIVIISTHYLQEYKMRKYNLIKLLGGANVQIT